MNISKTFKILYTASIANIINGLLCEKNILECFFTYDKSVKVIDYKYFSNMLLGGFLFSTLPALATTIVSKLIIPNDNVAMIGSVTAIFFGYDRCLQKTSIQQNGSKDIVGNLIIKGGNWLGKFMGDSTLGTKIGFIKQIEDHDILSSQGIALLQDHIIQHFSLQFKMNTLFQTMVFHSILSDDENRSDDVQYYDNFDTSLAAI